MNISKGPDRSFKTVGDIRSDMSRIIDWLYKLADYSDIILKTGITFINSVWFSASAQAAPAFVSDEVPL